MITVLCTSVGTGVFQAIVRALRGPDHAFTIIAVDTDPTAYGLYLADHGHLVPPRGEPDRLVGELLRICRRHGVQVLLPLTSEDVEFYAEHRESFERDGIRVAASELEASRIANDKHRLLEVIEGHGLSVPAHRIVSTMEELEAALADFGADRRPVVLKRRTSAGASGVKIVVPRLEPEQRLFSRDNITVPVDELKRWLARIEPFPRLQLTEYMGNSLYNIDLFLHHGRARGAMVRRTLSRLYGTAVTAVTVDQPEIREYGIAVAKALGLEYTVNVFMGYNARHEPALVEVNPRFPASIDHALMAGCNMPLWTVMAALGRPYEITPPRVGVRYCRHWHSLSVDRWLAPVDEDDAEARTRTTI